MKMYTLFLTRLNGQSKFRILATFFSIMLATFILAAIVSLGQGWVIRNDKVVISSAIFSTTTADSSVVSAATDNIHFSIRDSEFDGLSIKEIGIHKTNSTDGLPPGMTNLPTDNELWVTPTLKNLINANPSLKQRYEGYVIRDTFPREFAPSPDSLMLLYGIKPGVISDEDAQLKTVTTEQLWNTYNESKAQGSTQTTLLRTALLMVGVVLVVPLLILVTEVSRIGVTQREKKYATLSLVGATSAQIRTLAAIETVPIGLLGSAFGVVFFMLIGVTTLSRIPIGGSTFWMTDLGLSISSYAMICCVVTFCSFIVNLWALRSIKISPLTVSRTSNDIRSPSVLSTLPLLVGLGGIFIIAEYGSSWYDANMELGGIILVSLLAEVILGVYMSGQFITRLFSIFLLKYSKSASTTIAAYRLRMVARKTFRSISGVVLALFIGTILMTFLSTIQATADDVQSSTENVAIKTTNPLQLPLQVAIRLPQNTSTKTLSVLVERAANTEEITSLVSNTYVQKTFKEMSVSEDKSVDPIEGNYYKSCEQLRQRTVVTCSTDAPLNSPFVARLQIVNDRSSNYAVIQPNFTPTNTLEGVIYDNSYIFVAKNSASFSRVINATHTIASNYQMNTGIPLTVQHESLSANATIEYVHNISMLVVAVIILTIVIGGLSIFVSVTGNIFERKRTFVQLRILGSDTSTLAKALLIEIIVPLIGLSVVVVILGIFCCYYILSTGDAFSNGQLIFSVPDAFFWAGLCAAIVLCVVASLVNIPLLNKLTSFDDMRSE